MLGIQRTAARQRTCLSLLPAHINTVWVPAALHHSRLRSTTQQASAFRSVPIAPERGTLDVAEQHYLPLFIYTRVQYCNDLWLQLMTVSLCVGLIRRMYVGRERENSAHERGRAYFARPSRVSQLSLALGHVSLRVTTSHHLLISSVFVYVDRFILRCEYNYASRLRRVITSICAVIGLRLRHLQAWTKLCTQALVAQADSLVRAERQRCRWCSMS